MPSDQHVDSGMPALMRRIPRQRQLMLISQYKVTDTSQHSVFLERTVRIQMQGMYMWMHVRSSIGRRSV